MEDVHAFYQCIPDLSHRAQKIHHIVFMGAVFGVYVVSSLGLLVIVRMVWVSMEIDTARKYSVIFYSVAAMKPGWLYGD